ncbi:putative DNA-binding regulatory protein [Labilithrix luteola]|uniref:Putative DNA-binding regulatory protein n=2 Tax=Labilithrix luteola TaxID=1391654 RepID=A0A0K1PYK8_9BACT|nr:putative DNA-binding regulatory protein [Labilithrix luteola]
MVGRAKNSKTALSSIAELDSLATNLVARARKAWPDIDLRDEAFVEHVTDRVDDAEDVAIALDELHASDLWLALACGLGKKKALAKLDEQLVPLVTEALARMKEKVSREDIAQLLREKLLVSRNGEAPKILEYSGRGPLLGWIRIAAVRLAISSTRRGDVAAMQPVTREVLALVPGAIDPELDHLRARYSHDFKWAFEKALAGITVEERNILRMSLVDGLSIDEIGTIFGVHRATAARMLQRARSEVQEKTREILRGKLRVGTVELQSIMRFVRSHLDLSIQRLLTAEEAEEMSTSTRTAKSESTKTRRVPFTKTGAKKSAKKSAKKTSAREVKRP